MDTLNWLTNEISNIIASFVWSAVTWASILGILGFIGSIFMVRFFNRQGYFQRTNRLWTFFAKLNLAYLPMLCASLFVALGVIYGVQKPTNNWINKTTEPIVEYAVAFVPTIQQLGTHMDSQLTLEEALSQELFKGQNLADDSWEREMHLQYNSAITTAILDEFGYPHEIDGLISLVREQNLAGINAAFFTNLPAAIQDYCGTYFWVAYGAILMTFLPFFLFSLGEFGLYILYARLFQKSKIIPYTPSKKNINKAA